MKIDKNCLPKWHKEISTNDKLILTNDIDSLFSCVLLNHKFGCEITQFNDFDDLYQLDGTDSSNMIGVDLDIMKGRTFSNHKVYYPNEESINLNYDVDKYYKKYSFSTALMIHWLYYNQSKITLKMMGLLMTIDSGFLGYYSDTKLFKDVKLDWFNKMDIDFYITDLFKKIEKGDFYKIKTKFNLGGTIWIDENGFLQTNIKLEELSKWMGKEISLPKGRFKKVESFERYNKPLYVFKNEDKSDIYSHAMTRKEFVSYSISKKVD